MNTFIYLHKKKIFLFAKTSRSCIGLQVVLANRAAKSIFCKHILSFCFAKIVKKQMFLQSYHLTLFAFIVENRVNGKCVFHELKMKKEQRHTFLENYCFTARKSVFL